MASPEVGEAVAPASQRKRPKLETDNHARLATKRAELAAAERAYVAARTEMNVEDEIASRQRVEVLTGQVALLEAEASREADAAILAAARDRAVAVMRDHERMLARADRLDDALIKAAEAYRSAAQAVNDAARTLALHGAELDALRDRFGIDVPELARPVVPVRRPACITAVQTLGQAGLLSTTAVLAAMESDDTGLGRQRRTYQEIGGTETFELIAAAGLKPWPGLAAGQQRILAQRTEATERAVGVLQDEAARAIRRLADPRLGA